MKLMIKENVITDLKNMGVLNVNDEVKSILLNNYGLNINDCTLVPCRPRSYMAAKSNENVILGICNNYNYRPSWRDEGKKGPVVYAIFGKNDFYNVLSDAGIRYVFAQLDAFYEIIPADPETYKSKYDIGRNRRQDGYGYNDYRINDKGEVQYKDYSRTNSNKIRSLSQDEIKQYDPSYNRSRYAKILAKNHLDKYVKYYDDLCEDFEDILDRIKNLRGKDIIKNRTYYSSTTKCLDSFIDAMQCLNWKIEDVNKQDADRHYWYTYTESDLKDAFKRCQDKYVGLVNALENLESHITKSQENV